MTNDDRRVLIRLASALPSGSQERRSILSGLKAAGCEKLPEGGMRDNCEKKQEKGEDKKAGCEKLPEGGMRDNCEKKSKGGDKDKKEEKKASHRR